jgi:hypothetical protein
MKRLELKKDATSDNAYMTKIESSNLYQESERI